MLEIRITNCNDHHIDGIVHGIGHKRQQLSGMGRIAWRCRNQRLATLVHCNCRFSHFLVGPLDSDCGNCKVSSFIQCSHFDWLVCLISLAKIWFTFFVINYFFRSDCLASTLWMTQNQLGSPRPNYAKCMASFHTSPPKWKGFFSAYSQMAVKDSAVRRMWCQKRHCKKKNNFAKRIPNQM